LNWKIHEAEITVDGKLTADELSDYGISAGALDNNVSLKETFTVTPDDPLNTQSFLGLIMDLNVPEQASLSVKLQVDKDD